MKTSLPLTFLSREHKAIIYRHDSQTGHHQSVLNLQA